MKEKLQNQIKEMEERKMKKVLKSNKRNNTSSPCRYNHSVNYTSNSKH